MALRWHPSSNAEIAPNTVHAGGQKELTYPADRIYTSWEIGMPQSKHTIEELENRFRFHPASPEQQQKYEAIRKILLQTATFCVGITPASAEQTRAVNALDEAMMLFNAAIARHGNG